MDLIVNTDGASRGNPGKAAYGFIIKTKNGVILHQEGKKIGIKTNNFAEYSAVLRALEYISKYLAHRAPHNIEIVSDSELIVRQLDGRYKVKNANLKDLYKKIKDLEKGLGLITFKSVPRAKNYIADRLANIALDE